MEEASTLTDLKELSAYYTMSSPLDPDTDKVFTHTHTHTHTHEYLDTEQ